MPDTLESQLVDPQRLGAFLDDRLEGAGPFQVARHQAGHSNETFFIARSGSRWVLRRPPLAVYLPTAHDVLREYRILSALSSAGVRVPQVLLSCEDASVIGAPFYVMEKVEGAVIRDSLPPAIDNSDDRHRVGRELVAALAELHLVDHEEVGLPGRPGYVGRQVKRWSGQLELATSITSQRREVPVMWQVRDWLAAHLPAEGRLAVVHGDYKLDNVMFGPESPARLVAILDWEMSTVGDPLADLGWMLSFWAEADDPEDPVGEGLPRVTTGPGFLGRGELVSLYADLTGSAPGDLTWYVVLAIWKLACLLEGSFGRHLMGTTDDPFFASLETGVPALAERASRVAKEGFIT